MTENIGKLIYNKRKILFMIGVFLYIPMIVICILWVAFPEHNIFEPILVLLGFIVSVLSILPILISKVFPKVEISYRLKLRWGYGNSLPDSDKIIFISKSQNKKGFEKAAFDKIVLAMVFTNNSEKTIILKDIVLKYLDTNSEKKGIILNNFGNVSTLLSGESYSHVTPFLLFEKLIDKKLVKVSIEINGINFDYINKPRFIALENDLKKIIKRNDYSDVKTQ